MNGNYPVSWPYQEAANYQDWSSILQAFPHLKDVNPAEPTRSGNSIGIVIRSANDDNVHKAIKYGIWTTTPKNKNKIEQLWQRKLTHGTDTYLFYSAVKSGMFQGVARLCSGYHEETFPFWWENHTLKFKGYFQIEWLFIKDVNNKHFSGLYNTEGEEVVKSKDCDTLDAATTNRIIDIFGSRKVKRTIFSDFGYMDEREREYIRKMYEFTAYYNQYNVMGYGGHRYDLNQVNMVGNPLATMNQMPPQQQMTPMPQINGQINGQMNGNNAQSMQRPSNNEIPGSSLGFQMNPVSKNSKKK